MSLWGSLGNFPVRKCISDAVMGGSEQNVTQTMKLRWCEIKGWLLFKFNKQISLAVPPRKGVPPSQQRISGFHKATGSSETSHLSYTQVPNIPYRLTPEHSTDLPLPCHTGEDMMQFLQRVRVNILSYSVSMIFCLWELESEGMGFINFSFKTFSLSLRFPGA